MAESQFPDALFVYMNAHTMTGIRGGTTRPGFLEMWMVTVDGRIFARSWNKSARSWFTAIQETGVGAIQFGDQEIAITGKKLATDDPVHPRIDQAYLDKYSQPHNLEYAEGIAQPEYWHYTMEFFPA